MTLGVYFVAVRCPKCGKQQTCQVRNWEKYRMRCRWCGKTTRIKAKGYGLRVQSFGLAKRGIDTAHALIKDSTTQLALNEVYKMEGKRTVGKCQECFELIYEGDLKEVAGKPYHKKCRGDAK